MLGWPATLSVALSTVSSFLTLHLIELSSVDLGSVDPGSVLLNQLEQEQLEQEQLELDPLALGAEAWLESEVPARGRRLFQRKRTQGPSH